MDSEKVHDPARQFVNVFHVILNSERNQLKKLRSIKLFQPFAIGMQITPNIVSLFTNAVFEAGFLFYPHALSRDPIRKRTSSFIDAAVKFTK
jgi:hypothetical protein